MQFVCEGIGCKAANVAHHHEHGVLHGRIRDGAEVPQSPGEQDVEILRDESDLADDHRLAVIGPQGREQEHVLQGETVLGVVSHMLQARDRLLRSFDEAQILAAIEGEVAVDEAIEVVALLKACSGGGISKPTMELGSDAIEILRLRAFLAFANFGGVLAAEPCLKEGAYIPFYPRGLE